MPKEFITERDVEDLVKRGIMSLEVNDNVVLTDLAYEKANRLGLRLVRDKPDNPPAAPVRPYLAEKRPAPTSAAPVSSPAGGYTAPTSSLADARLVPPAQADGAGLHQRIHDAVIARLGSQVDPVLLDAIIRRVLQATGVK